MKNRLDINPIVLQIPVGDAENFNGVIDLLTLKVLSKIFLVKFKKIMWIDEMGDRISIEDLKEGTPLYEKAIKEREKMIETVATFDDRIAVKNFFDLLIF